MKNKKAFLQVCNALAPTNLDISKVQLRRCIHHTDCLVTNVESIPGTVRYPEVIVSRNTKLLQKSLTYLQHKYQVSIEDSQRCSAEAKLARAIQLGRIATVKHYNQ